MGNSHPVKYNLRGDFGADKNVQSHRISASSVQQYGRDGFQRDRYNDKTQREASRLPFLNFELISAKSSVLNIHLTLQKHAPFHFFGLRFSGTVLFIRD